ncbi:MAG: hypothetical protein ED559_09455 [Phycisphaera sp.]|nr:MAG: hypothetical protein ED559_09455 [Phycisphaera sp.]
MTQDHPIQRLAQIGIALVGGLVALSALPGIWIGLFGHEAWGTTPLPLLAGFELLTLLAGVTAVVIGFRPRGDGFGLAGLCIAGGIMVSAVLGSIIFQNSGPGVPPLKSYVMLRLLAMALIAALTGVVKLSDRMDCWKRVVIGAAMLLPLAAMGGLFVTGRGGRVSGLLAGTGPIMNMVLWTLLAVVLGILTIAGGHILIRAFELTREPKSGTADPE